MASFTEHNPSHHPRQRRSLVLCFDGTGNKFQGNEGDSNILKIFSMLEKQKVAHHAYYQPGIGTYVEDSALTKTGRFARIKSWYMKAKDQAVGTSFADHVAGGYKFLMQHYEEGDDIYMFGFSRGAYTARFLAQMLDAVGLLSSGNEQMFRFAWKTFAQWQNRLEETDEQKEQKHNHFNFMRAFRETFSRPVKRVRFIGLFDTVNSVKQFESRWMRRSRFPYTAKSSAKVIRHAVSIDERRAKFRQNLISQKKDPERSPELPHLHIPHHHHHEEKEKKKENGTVTETNKRPALPKQQSSFHRFQPRRKSQLNIPSRVASAGASSISVNSITVAHKAAQDGNDLYDDDSDDETTEQDIQEVWFPGCHADIGGGWPLEKGESIGLSHPPLIWMIHEARKAGLPFDQDSLECAGYILPPDDNIEATAFPQPAPPRHQSLAPDMLSNRFVAASEQQKQRSKSMVPTLQLDGASLPTSPIQSPPIQPAFNDPFPSSGKDKIGPSPNEVPPEAMNKFLDALHTASTGGRMHDSLEFKTGTPATGVLSWRIMEYMPFRRMDLRPDGTWAPIRFPLPMGEVRDMPRDALIHNSAIKRMEMNKDYRPGNLIVGGGGRGVRKAPEEYGMGEWKAVQGHGSAVEELYVRKEEVERVEEALKQTGANQNGG